MKALTLKQPWAELILNGRKTVETRTWNTSFRGKFLIHASLNPDEKAMQLFGYSDLPCGCIVGEAELTGVVEYNTEAEWKSDKRHCAASIPFDRKRYGFVLTNVKRRKAEPIKGKLGFWDK